MRTGDEAGAFGCKIFYFTLSSEHLLEQIYMIYKLVFIP